MKKKGLVYRFTTIFGLSIIAFQFGGELFYSKYIKADRDYELETEEELQKRKSKFNEDGENIDDALNEDINKNKKGGMFKSWSETRR